MKKHAFRQLVANKARLALTSFAIAASVAFVTAAFILGNGYSDVIYGWGEGQTAGIDLLVEPEAPFGPSNFEVNPARVDDTTLEQVRAVPGVADARANLWADNLHRPTLPTGELVANRFAVTVHGWVEGNNFTIAEGLSPGPGEFTIDTETAETYDYQIGDTYSLTTPNGTRELQLVGFMEFSEGQGTTAGQVLLTMDVADLQDTLGQPGYVNINVNVTEGSDVETVRQSLQAALPADLAVQTKAEVVEVLNERVSPYARGFRGGLLGFGLISVFVSAFIIYNTFTVLLSQRTRELGLLRAVGADSKQIRRSIAIEALVLGAGASVLGIGLGLLLSAGMSRLLRASGGLPSPDLVLSPGIVALSMAVGTIMTFLAASAPARKACRIPVIVALNDGVAVDKRSSKWRFFIGMVITLVGAAGVALGLAGAGSTQVTLAALGLGAMLVFVGVALLNPLWMRPIANVLGWPLARFFGVPGKIARENIGRNPRRSATTAASLMIGLALISMVLVVGQSVKQRVSEGAASAYRSDHIVANTFGYKYGIAVADDLEALDVVGQTAAISFDLAEIDGQVRYMAIGDYADVDPLIDFEIVGIEATELAAMASEVQPLLVTESRAEEEGINIGDTVPITFFNGTETSLTVTGFFRNNAAGGNDYYLARDTWFEHTGQTTVDIIAVQSSAGTSPEAFRADIDKFEAANGQVTVETIDDYVATTGDTINQTLGVLNVMMALAILISFLGIANTLALSIFERTKEIGLLRAVGMKRGQLRRMIRYEAALISLFGSVVGATIGIAFGAASVVAIPASVARSISVPFGQIAVLLVLSSLAGVIAAALPAWRAARRSALELISS